jgi:hypothetical protein
MVLGVITHQLQQSKKEIMFILILLLMTYLSIGIGTFTGLRIGKGPLTTWEYRFNQNKDFIPINKWWTKIYLTVFIIISWPYIILQLMHK